jgi:hypothetical protein
MDTAEAKSILVRELAKFRAKPYSELVGLIENVQTLELTAPSGTWYQLEFEATWDDPSKPNDVLRVFGTIDDGGIRAFSPLSEDFLMAANGAFIDE